MNNSIKKEILQLNKAEWNTIFSNITDTNPSDHKFCSNIKHSNHSEQNFLPNTKISTIEKTELFAERFKKIFSNNKYQQKKINKDIFNYYKSKRYNQVISVAGLEKAIKKLDQKSLVVQTKYRKFYRPTKK